MPLFSHAIFAKEFFLDSCADLVYSEFLNLIKETMFTNPGFTLSDQIAATVELFCKIMPAEACKLRVGVLSIALWTRVRRLGGRFCKLYAMWKAGTLPPRSSASPAVKSLDRGGRGDAQRGDGGEGGAVAPPPPQPSPVKGEGEMSPGNAARVRPASLLPRRFAWMQKMLPTSAATLASYVGSIVCNHPEVQAFVAEVPQAGRLLRPLLELGGLKAPEWLALPKRTRVRAAAHPSPRPSPSGGEGARRRRFATPREEAAAAIRRCHETGKPVDPKKISWKAFQYVLHWPREPPDAEVWR